VRLYVPTIPAYGNLDYSKILFLTFFNIDLSTSRTNLQLFICFCSTLIVTGCAPLTIFIMNILKKNHYFLLKLTITCWLRNELKRWHGKRNVFAHLTMSVNQRISGQMLLLKFYKYLQYEVRKCTILVLGVVFITFVEIVLGWFTKFSSILLSEDWGGFSKVFPCMFELIFEYCFLYESCKVEECEKLLCESILYWQGKHLWYKNLYERIMKDFQRYFHLLKIFSWETSARM